MNKYLKPGNYKKVALKKIIGGQITYSQLGEDLIADFILNYKKGGFYVDVGANDPFLFSNTCLFNKKGWRGINIDPNRKNIEKFKKYRPKDVNLRTGVGAHGVMPFYEFTEDVLNTFNKELSQKNIAMGHSLVRTEQVPVTPLSEILQQYAPDTLIDLMSIDTEGHDMQVLQSNDWGRFRPRVIILETLEYTKDGSGKKFNDIFDPYLRELGYRPVAETHLNTLYLDIK